MDVSGAVVLGAAHDVIALLPVLSWSLTHPLHCVTHSAVLAATYIALAITYGVLFATRSAASSPAS